MSDAQFIALIDFKFKDPKVALLLAIFVGCFGADRFYLESYGLGVLKLLTLGGSGILALIDIITAIKRTKTYNTDKLHQSGLIGNTGTYVVPSNDNTGIDIEKLNNYAKKASDFVNSKEFQNFKEGWKQINDSGYVVR